MAGSLSLRLKVVPYSSSTLFKGTYRYSIAWAAAQTQPTLEWLTLQLIVMVLLCHLRATMAIFSRLTKCVWRNLCLFPGGSNFTPELSRLVNGANGTLLLCSRMTIASLWLLSLCSLVWVSHKYAGQKIGAKRHGRHTSITRPLRLPSRWPIGPTKAGKYSYRCWQETTVRVQGNYSLSRAKRLETTARASENYSSRHYSPSPAKQLRTTTPAK